MVCCCRKALRRTPWYGINWSFFSRLLFPMRHPMAPSRWAFIVIICKLGASDCLRVGCIITVVFIS